MKYPQYNLMNDVLICLEVWTCAIIPPDFTSSAVTSPHRVESRCKILLLSSCHILGSLCGPAKIPDKYMGCM